MNTVNLAMDYDDWKKFCLQNGYKLEDTLDALKKNGISSFGIYEDTPKRLQERGEITVYSGFDILNAYRLSGTSNQVLGKLAEDRKIVPDNIYILFPDNSPYVDRLQKYFFRFFGHDRVTLHSLPMSPYVLEIQGAYSDVVNLGIGLPEHIVSLLSSKGFYIVARMENRILKEEDLDFIFQEIPLSCTTLIFSGMNNEVLGYPDLLEKTASIMEQKNLYFGFIEVADLENLQKGSITLAGRNITRVVRVISMSSAYQDKLKLDQIIDMWNLAVTERNMRLLYLRPLTKTVEKLTPLESNIYYLGLCRDNILASGFNIGGTEGMNYFSPHLVLKIFSGLGAVCAGILILARIFQLPFKYSLLTGSVCAAILLAGLVLAGSLMAKICALMAGIIFPVFAIIFGFPGLFSPGKLSVKNPLFFALKTVCIVSLLTVIGSIITMSMVSSTKFFLTVERFKGVKFIMTIPIFLIIIFYIYAGTEGNKLENFLKKARSFLEKPVYLGQICAFFLIGMAGVFYLLRTGNTTVVPVSDFERNLRSFLDALLIVRPRFKDFLIGEPALFLAAYLWSKGHSSYLWIFLALACMGQADIMDTFAHLHTPLPVSLLRVFHGLWIGSCAGFFVILLYNICFRGVTGNEKK
ncbi:MAG: DUF5693 family protein [Candidatus Eremiobacterota bacterium]